MHKAISSLSMVTRTSAAVVIAVMTIAHPVQAVIPAARHLTVSEGFVNPVGFYDANPTFSWKLPVTEGLNAQTAYRVQVASTRERLAGEPDLWDSGKTASTQSLWIPYQGALLTSRRQALWRVKFWDQDGRESAWSPMASFELGLLTAEDWDAAWIQLSLPDPAFANAPSSAPTIVVAKAFYGIPGEPAKQVDVAEAIRGQVEQGKHVVLAGNDLAGRDPAYGVVKSLILEYTLDGEPYRREVPEGENINLVSGGPSTSPGETAFVPEYVRREFTAGSKIAGARLYVTARGVFEIRLNGKKVGDAFMAPGWTPYHKWIETVTYDVGDQLRPGANAMGAVLGEGWYGGRLAGWVASSGKLPRPWLLAQLEITYADGRVERVTTDGAWTGTREGPIRFSGIYDGEIYDARMELGAFSTAGFDDSGWLPVVTEEIDPGIRLTPKRQHPVRPVKKLPVVEVTEPRPGRYVFDLGQNLVGWPELRIPVRKDETITVRFAEMLKKDGSLYTDNYRSAKSINQYTAKADGMVTWHPTFTFHGFRYVELSGFPKDVTPVADWVTGHVLHSDFAWAGEFSSSHPKLNHLQRNIQWGLRGNFLDIPTDCPQRDERLGWTGDAQVFAPTSLFNAQVYSFWASWLESMRDEQTPAGVIPSVIPNCLGQGNVGGSGWSDAATVIPWEVYVRTGDLRILRDNFDMMKRWTGYHEATARDLIATVRSYGDWLQPYRSGSGSVGDAAIDLIGTAYFARSADLTARAAERLGEQEEAARLTSLFEKVSHAFVDRFLDENGTLTTETETQTGYLLALGFGLVPEERKAGVLANLVKLVDVADGHLRTGFLGTPLLAPVLDDHGRSDLAYAAVFKETYPSWFFSINQGATTMWERWNSYSHQDGFGDAGMNSFNHYAYGAIGEWMYERMAGLAPDPEHPGYKHFFIQPIPGGPLTSANATLETPYGTARSAWEKKGQGLHMEAVIPPNTTATVVFPQGTNRSISVNGAPLNDMGPDVPVGITGSGLTTAVLPAGTYRFVVR